MPIRQDNLKLACVAILFTCLALSFGDALIKQQSASFGLWQIFILRSLIVIPLLIVFMLSRKGDKSIKPVRPGWTIVRSFILVLMWVFYFTALPRVELAIAAAAFYTLPIFISLFAALFLGDRIGRQAALAIVIGFVGMLLILQPQSDDFNAYSLLPVLSAICYAAAMILTRSHCRDEKPLVLSLWLNLGFVLAGLCAVLVIYLWQPDAQLVENNSFLLGEWVGMTTDGWKAMAILAVAILIGSVGTVIAYQNGPPLLSLRSIIPTSFSRLSGDWYFLMKFPIRLLSGE